MQAYNDKITISPFYIEALVVSTSSISKPKAWVEEAWTTLKAPWAVRGKKKKGIKNKYFILRYIFCDITKNKNKETKNNRRKN